MGQRSFSACSWMRTIFSTVRRPHEPALTVESLAITATTLPLIFPTPVTTPSAGSSGSVELAKAPSSTKLSGSRSSRTRSRAKSLPDSAFFWWYFGAPPFSMRASAAFTLSSNPIAGALLAHPPAHGYTAHVLRRSDADMTFDTFARMLRSQHGLRLLLAGMPPSSTLEDARFLHRKLKQAARKP